MTTAPLLIVDDDPVNLQALRQALEGEYRLVYARSGSEALAAARKHAPALVLLDISMPDQDGYEVCRRLKSLPATADIPVIFVTTLASVGNEAEGFACGAVDYIIKPVSPPLVQARVRAHLSRVRASRLEQSYREALYMLSMAGHYNDTDTGVHVWRMAAYAGRLARAAGWSEERSSQLELAAPMHDTGKIGIPAHILRKAGSLDEPEWEIMKTHTLIGYEILRQSNAPVFQLAAEVALHHHERWDGTGYPSNVAGMKIPECARIVAVADVFDALTMKRPYKPAWPMEQAVATIRDGAGSHFEPRLVEAFFGILPEIAGVKRQWDAREAGAEPVA